MTAIELSIPGILLHQDSPRAVFTAGMQTTWLVRIVCCFPAPSGIIRMLMNTCCTRTRIRCGAEQDKSSPQSATVPNRVGT
jgi:hypothetical protein